MPNYCEGRAYKRSSRISVQKISVLLPGRELWIPIAIKSVTFVYYFLAYFCSTAFLVGLHVAQVRFFPRANYCKEFCISKMVKLRNWFWRGTIIGNILGT